MTLIRNLTTFLVVASASCSALALPTVVTRPLGTGSTHSIFLIDAKKLKKQTAAQALTTLRAQLDPFGISPCLVTHDVNATGIRCGGGLVQFGINELFSYNLESNLQEVPIALDRGVKQLFGANFRSPVGTIPGDATGRVIHVHFAQPVAQFGMVVDPGQLTAPSLRSIRFVVKGVSTPAKRVVPGTTPFVGVRDPAGFTDLVIVPVGGASQSYVADQFEVVTSAQFR